MTLPNHLSVAMREGSAAEHRDAEGSVFMEQLVAGNVALEDYVEYLVRFRTVYGALESVGKSLRDDPIVAAVYDPALHRLDAINADLAALAPSGVPVVVSPATDAYVARVLASSAWGGLYIAHHYTRFLGDLSGGQVIGRVLTRTYDMSGGGVEFYAFDDIPKPKPYKDGYRARLDALPLTDAEKARVVDEVKVAFQLNRAIFDELGDYRSPLGETA